MQVERGEIWENAFDNKRVTVLGTRKNEHGVDVVEYVKEGITNPVTKPKFLFLSMYKKISS